MTDLFWEQIVERWLMAGRQYRSTIDALLTGVDCWYCGRPAQTLDHIQPRAAGGSDEPRNLIPACQSCNGSKGAKSLNEWATNLRRFVENAKASERRLAAVEELIAILEGRAA